MRSALWVLLWCLVAALVVQQVNSQYSSSTESMKELVEVGISFAEVLSEYVEKHEKNNKKLKQYLNQLQIVTDLAKMETEHFVGNPLHSYTFIRLMTYTAKIFELTKKTYQYQGLMDFYKKFQTGAAKKLPNTEDFVGSLAAMRRLIDLYNIKPESFQEDFIRISGVASEFSHIDPQDYIELGKYFMNLKEMHLAYAFANKALDTFNKNRTSVFVGKKDVYELLSDIAFYQDNYKKAIDYTQEILKLHPKDKQALGEIKAYNDLLGKMNTKYEDLEDKEMITEAPAASTQNEVTSIREKYKEICSDRSDKYAPKGDLVCRYVNPPLLRIAPFKAEQLHSDPEILLFYDTLSQGQIRQLKELTTEKMKANAQYLQYQNAKTHTFEFKDSKVVKQVDFITKSLTNLNIDSSDDLQVANYGMAGHYVPHFDFLSADSLTEDPRGNRLATVMTYLSTPDLGGETIFIELGLKIKPIKGASVFWYNLDDDAQPERRTLHAACPVLAGHKWIATKWIRERYN